MFNLIKTCIVLAMLIGIVVLGVKLHRKATENGTAVTAEAKKIGDEIKKIAKEAVKETETLQKAYTLPDRSEKRVNDVQNKNETRGVASHKNPVFASYPGKKRETTKSTLSPMDEEDRVLTEEILAESSEKDKGSDPSELNKLYAEASISESELTQGEGMDPMDLNRLTEVRIIYLKALEILDLD